LILVAGRGRPVAVKTIGNHAPTIGAALGFGVDAGTDGGVSTPGVAPLSSAKHF